MQFAIPAAQTCRDARQSLGVQIPVMSRLMKPSARVWWSLDAEDGRAEKVRTLCSELLLRDSAGQKLSGQSGAIALISPSGGDGRTQLSAELAISLAQLGRSTLLVDADLRRPQLHLLFNSHNGPGLAQSLERGVEPHLFAVAGLRTLSLLTAGSTPRNPMELLSHERFALMMEDWRSRFEFIVLDTAPIAFYADGLVVASRAGCVLALSRANHTRHNDTKDMLRRLTAARVTVAGAVISHF
jgi:protein-tyrosine kinase